MTLAGNTYLPGLLWTLVRTEFKSRYHGTIGGFLWALLRPTAMFFVLLSVFSFIFRIDPNYNLNLVVGLFLWDFFAEATKSGVYALQAKGFLLTKASVPPWVVIVTSPSNALISVGVFSIVLFTYLGLSGHPLGITQLALYGGYMVIYAIQVTGISLATSALFLKYRDFNQIWDLIIQVGFFLAPIIYPLDILPERAHFLAYAWLPTPIIQFSRAVLVSNQIPTMRAHLMLIGVNLLVLGVGVLIFRKLAPRAIEEL